MINSQWELFQKKVEPFSKKERHYLHFQSVKNFVLNIESFSNSDTKKKATEILENYFLSLEKANYQLDRKDGLNFFYTHITKLGQLYSYYQNFHIVSYLWYAIIWGLILDFVCLVSGISANFFYVPIFTFGLFLQNRFKYFKYVKRNKAYGPLY